MLPDWTIDLDTRFKPAAPLGFGPFGERAPIPANDQGSTLSRSVSDDLQAIFAEAPPTPPARRSSRVHSIAPHKPSTSKASHITAWGGMIAAAVAGIVVGTMVVKQPPKAPPPPAAVVAQAPTARDLSPAPKLTSPHATPGLQAEPPKAMATAKATPPRSRPATVRRAATPSRGAVLAADRQLRQAYATAARAGVPRGRLVSVRNRWIALRDDPPARLVAGYGALTRDLRQQAAAARSHPRKRGLFG